MRKENDEGDILYLEKENDEGDILYLENQCVSIIKKQHETEWKWYQNDIKMISNVKTGLRCHIVRRIVQSCYEVLS